MKVYSSTDLIAVEREGEHESRQRLAVLAVFSVMIATVCSLAYMPVDPKPPGALFEVALLMTIGLLVGPVVATCYEPKSLFRAENIVALAPIYWLLLDLLQGAYSLDGVSEDDIKTAFLCIGGFAISMWAGCYGKPWRVPRMIVTSATTDLPGEVYFRLTVAAFFLGILKFAIAANFNIFEMFAHLGGGRWSGPWSRGQLGGWDAFQDQLQYFGYLLPALTVIVAHHVGWSSSRSLVLVGMAIVMTLFLMQGGGRRIIGMIFGMAIILWVLLKDKLRVRHAIIVIASVVLVLITLQLMVEHRDEGLGRLASGDETNAVFQREHLHVDDNFLRLSQIINLVPEFYPYIYHKLLFWILVRPIPRVFWPGKPLDPGFDLASAVGESEVSLSSSVLGELYLSWGVMGIIIGGWLFGRLARTVGQLLNYRANSSALIIYAIFTMSLFVGFRSMMEILLMNYALAAWVGLTFAYRYLRR